MGVGPEESVANRVAQALAGSQGAGTAMELLCANPSGLPAVGTFLRFFPQAAHPVPPNSWEGVGLLDGEFCGATALHRAASNPSITEDLLETIADAAPEAVLLTDELGRLPIHLLAANPGPSCDIWTLKRLMERTPPPCFKLVSEAPNAPTILHALCGRREKDDADTAEAVQMLLDACQCQTAAWPGLYYHSPPASATFHLEDGTAVAKPTWLKKHVDWPQTWTLHRGGALQLARQHGLAATVEVLEGAGFVVDESATDDFAAFWPRRDRTKLFLDAKATKPAPDGTIPFRWCAPLSPRRPPHAALTDFCAAGTTTTGRMREASYSPAAMLRCGLRGPAPARPRASWRRRQRRRRPNEWQRRRRRRHGAPRRRLRRRLRRASPSTG